MQIISAHRSRISRYIFNFEKPKTYLNLMQKVGDAGKYQKKMLTVFMLNWFVTGIILLSNVFLFRNKVYDCIQNGVLLENDRCISFVCTLPENMWKQYESTTEGLFENIATINNFQCQSYIVTFLASTSTHIGAILGFLTMSFVADNFGRKLALVIAWTICVCGSILVVFGFHIFPVTLGLFLSGFGGDAANSITLLFFCEVLNNRKRQQYSVIVQIFFTIGALVATVLFYIINSWRIVWSVLVIIPALVELVMLYSYIQETPHFLLKKGSAVALTALNRIGMINLDRRETLEEQQVQNVIDSQMVQEFKEVYITHIDLCRFTSLRTKVVICSIIAVSVYGMYYSPVLAANSIGLDIYSISFIVLGSDFLVYFPTLLMIQKIKRRYFGIGLLSLAVLCSVILFYVGESGTCGFCLENSLQIVFLVIFRASVSYYFSFFWIYISEIFPARVRGLSFGITSAFGSISSVVTPAILTNLFNDGVDGVFLFAVTGIIAAGGLILLPQTRGVPLKQDIQEIQMHKIFQSSDRRIFDSDKKWTSELPKKRNKKNRIIQSGNI